MAMEGSSSSQPPTVDGFFAFRYPSWPSWPSWVLLDKRVYFAHHVNATTKKVKMSIDQEVHISFCFFDPADISHCCVHSPQILGEDTFEARVVSSAQNLVLLCFAFRTGPRSTAVNPGLVEFFVCMAGSGGNLSIEPVPYSPTGTRHSWHAAIVPRGGGDSDFLVADLSPRGDPGHYDLHVYSSETSKWTTTYLQLQTPADTLPRDLPGLPDKVISLGGSVLGWVDLWRGIVFCDLLEKEPVLSFIPLPTTAFDLPRTGQAHKVRDVTVCKGLIRFVEIEFCLRELNIVNTKSFKTTQDLDTQDVMPDKACLIIHDDLDDKPAELVPDGWKIRTMFKGISWDYWKRKHTVHVDDISAQHSVLPPQVSSGGAMKCTLRNIITGFPFFGVYGDNVVYLMSKVESDNEDSWIVGVDLEGEKLEVIKPYCAASATSSDPTLLPCAFSEYMNATPRPYDELVAARFSRNGVLNNHLPSGGTVPVASSAQDGVPNNHLPSGSTVPVASSAQNGMPNNHLPSGSTVTVASSAQNGVPNGHPPLGDNVTDNVQRQQNTSNVDGYNGSLNGSGYYGAHSGYGNYQQPTLLRPPQYVLPPSLPPTVQPMSSSTRSGYIFARWSDPDEHGKMVMTMPLNDMLRMAAAPLAPSTPPMPVHPPFAKPFAPNQTFAP